MRIVVGWDDPAEKSIIRWDIADPQWGLEDFWQAIARTGELSAQAEGLRRVDVVVSVSGAVPSPRGLLSAFKSVDQRLRGSMVVIAGPNAQALALVEMFKQVYGGAEWRTASTVEAAREMIDLDRRQNAQ